MSLRSQEKREEVNHFSGSSNEKGKKGKHPKEQRRKREPILWLLQGGEKEGTV